MKQSTFKTKLNQYFDDVDQYIDTLVECNVECSVLDKILDDRMTALGVERQKDQSDIMFDIIANEEDARKEGREPVRRVYYYTEYEEPDIERAKAGKEQKAIREVWIDYTEDDYYFFLAWKKQIEQQTVLGFTRLELNASVIIGQHFNEDADLVTAGCLSILHTVTKADCEDYLRRTRERIRRIDNKDTKDYLLKRLQEDVAGTLEVDFLGNLLNPFSLAIQGLRHEERKKQEDQDPKGFIDFIFRDIRHIHDETREIISQWYGASSKDKYLRHSKLARTKEINALQTLNLARDNKGVKQETTSSGGLKPVTVFENKGVEIVTTRIEDLALSTNTRQILDFFFFKGIEQIPHKGSIERIYNERAVTVDLDELATVFSIDKKDARKRLNNFYDEVRDLKIKVSYVVKNGKKYDHYVATVNIFDADLQKIDQEEKNATARPEDVDEGVQITLYNTGTLLNYSPKRKKAPKNAVQRGRLTMQFSMDFARHLSQASIVRHNPKGYLINRKKYSSSYSVQCSLENHAHMNRGKNNEGVISLGSLLKDCYEIPTYETVMNGNRNITARIKKPLLSTIQALKDGGVLQDFFYCDPMKRTTEEADLLTLDYGDFIDCTLHFTLSPIEE